MPIPAPEEVFESNVTTDFSHNAILKITEHLRDPYWINKWQRGDKNNPYFRFILQGFATKGDKEKIIFTLLGSGWGAVNVMNSSENGERGGLVEVKVYRYKQLKE